MGWYTEEMADSAIRILRVLREFGVAEESIISRCSGNYVDNPGEDMVETVLDAVYSVEGYEDPSEYPGYIVGSEAQKLVEFLFRSERGFSKDIAYRQGDVISVCLNPILLPLGYKLGLEQYDGAEWETNTTLPRTEHPPAIKILFQDINSSETEEIFFRYPPQERGAAVNITALMYTINRNFLEKEGYSIIALNDKTSLSRFFVIETERLDRLEEKYGESLEIFGRAVGGRISLESALSRYDRSCKISHKEEYGCPEPKEVYKIEDEIENQVD